MTPAATTALGFLPSLTTSPDRARRVASYAVLPPPMESIRLAEVPGEPGCFAVAERYQFETPTGRKVTIPAGYQTDLATSPKLLWGVLAPHELGFTSVAIHDYLCQHGAELGISREEADDIFQAVMELQRIDRAKADKAMIAVRLWTEFRNREAALAEVIEGAGNWSSLGTIAKTILPVLSASLRGGKLGLVTEAVRVASRGIGTLLARHRAKKEAPALPVHEPLTIERMVSLQVPHEEWPTFEPRTQR